MLQVQFGINGSYISLATLPIPFPIFLILPIYPCEPVHLYYTVGLADITMKYKYRNIQKNEQEIGLFPVFDICPTPLPILRFLQTQTENR